ncbi:hypothetical protein ED28_03190 [[Pantoea] beijingensis]|uniref:Uncharacterized protein n=1 Tax=[Pantoea] beijingensis TaxID=1324864 RepID=A0A443IGV3_9GAMM|nr:hypothetical protein ED28_03190 [[Pantoea] beijingensis]
MSSEYVRIRKKGANDEQIKPYLRNPDGSVKTTRNAIASLHAAGLGASSDRVHALLSKERNKG